MFKRRKLREIIEEYRFKRTWMRRAVENYHLKLASSETVNREEAITAHLASLYLSRDLELRIRHIQTLAGLDFDGILPLVLGELAFYSGKRRESLHPEYYRILLRILLPDSPVESQSQTPKAEDNQFVDSLHTNATNEQTKPSSHDLPSEGDSIDIAAIDILATVATIKSFRNVIDNLRSLLESQDKLKRSENDYQKILASNPWMLGSQYTELLVKEFWIDTTARVDLMLANAVGYVDVVELKRPDAKILSQGSRPGTWRPSPELSDAQAQARKYLQILDENRLLIESKYPFTTQSVSRLYRSGVIIVAGRTPTERGALNTLRDINVGEHRILILTYDDVLAIAEATIRIFERRLQRSPLLG